MTQRWAWALVFVVAALAVVGTRLVSGRPALSQPLSFSHRLHTEDAGMDCSDCHQHVFSGQRATIPNVTVCADCHEEAQTDSEDERLLVERIVSAEPIPWFRVTRVPPDVYFSHRRHAAIAEIACEDCHGEMRSRERPLTRPLRRPTMDRCIECHEQSGVTSDCISCHR